jgi:hypothetical protein
MEIKLKQGGINIDPLSWGAGELISGHVQELDYNPVVLECTEVYLDTRSFYDHAASKDWLVASAEVWKASRSLKPTTYCLGNPGDEIWEKHIEPTLKAIRLDSNKPEIDQLQSGVFFYPFQQKEGEQIFWMDLDFVVSNKELVMFQAQLMVIQKALEAPCMIILPTSIEAEHSEVRVMLSFIYTQEIICLSLKQLKDYCKSIQGQLIVFLRNRESLNQADQWNDIKQRNIEAAQRFLEKSGMDNISKISCVDGHNSEKACTLAGYPLHPLYQQLVVDETLNYKM